MINPSQRHISVMLNEVIDHLQPKADGIYIDGTLGMGGHSDALLSKLNAQGRLIGLDRDHSALVLAHDRLRNHGEKFIGIHNDFRHIPEVLKSLAVDSVDGILLDLGISSFQLDDPQRGFSFLSDGPLDMRMDKSSFISAEEMINSLSEKELSDIFYNFGEERFSNRIARLIVARRQTAPIKTTSELAQLVSKAMPYGHRREKIHPATRTFQAIRIAVNRELEALETALNNCISSLKTGGRIVVISFHSLEDRIVKEKFRYFAQQGQLNILTKKPLRPSEQECRDNSRSRSAKLRAAERI